MKTNHKDNILKYTNALAGQTHNNLYIGRRKVGRAPSILRKEFSILTSLKTGSSGKDRKDEFSNSPIPSDLEEDLAELSKNYLGKDTEFIHRQEKLMENVAEKSKTYVSEVLEDRSNERSNLSTDELKNFDKETKKIIREEKELLQDNINTIAYNRDTVLDMNNGVQRNTPGSDYMSDYDSPTSQAEYNGIDNKQSNIQNNYNNHIDGVLRGLPGSDTSSEVSISSPSSNQTSSDNEVSSTNLLDENNPQKKRKFTELDSGSDNSPLDKKFKGENTGDIPDKKSPLDYVLEKEDCNPPSFFDDIDF